MLNSPPCSPPFPHSCFHPSWFNDLNSSEEDDDSDESIAIQKKAVRSSGLSAGGDTGFLGASICGFVSVKLGHFYEAESLTLIFSAFLLPISE